jgi:hypothetical protein
MPQSPLSHQLPQDALPLAHPTGWPHLPEPQRQECHARIAQRLPGMVHGAQSQEQSQA